MLKKTAISVALLVGLSACMQPTPEQRAEQNAYLDAAHEFDRSR
jgi:hypothetical protein